MYRWKSGVPGCGRAGGEKIMIVMVREGRAHDVRVKHDLDYDVGCARDEKVDAVLEVVVEV